MNIGELIIETYRKQIGLRYPPIKRNTSIKGFRWKNCDQYYDWSTGKEISEPYDNSSWFDYYPKPYYLVGIYNDSVSHNDDMDIVHKEWYYGHMSCTIPYPMVPPAGIIY